MAKPVKITAPTPTIEELGEKLGLSKARRRSLAPIFVERRASGRFAVIRNGSERASGVYSTQKEAVEKARDLRPNGTILVERVRPSADGGRDQWRKT